MASHQARRTAEILAQLPTEQAQPIRDYITLLRRQLAQQRTSNRERYINTKDPAYPDALRATINAAKNGATIQDLAKHTRNLKPHTAELLGMSLWNAARNNLLD